MSGAELKLKHPAGADACSSASRALPLWPASSVPSAEEAERVVRDVLAGEAQALDATLVARLLEDLTDLERAALGADGEPTRPLRAIAGLRWRLGAAIVTAPERGAYDADAAAALLADADALLAELQRGAEGAPEAVVGAVAEIRKVLVRDAIALGNALQRLAASSADTAPAPAAAKAVEARLLSIVEGSGVEPAAERRSSRKLWVVFVLVAVAAAGYHGWRWTQRPVPVPAIEGAPLGVIASGGSARQTLIFTRDGKAMSASDLERLSAAQAQRNMHVRELSPGVYAVEPVATKEVTR
jgi:hypothetical protein